VAGRGFGRLVSACFVDVRLFCRFPPVLKAGTHPGCLCVGSGDITRLA
jgi:hypothetical protein